MACMFFDLVKLTRKNRPLDIRFSRWTCSELYQVWPMGAYCSITPPFAVAKPALLERLSPVTKLLARYCGYGSSDCRSVMVEPFRLVRVATVL